jgi:hypothetical protein
LTGTLSREEAGEASANDGLERGREGEEQKAKGSEEEERLFLFLPCNGEGRREDRDATEPLSGPALVGQAGN